MRDVYYSDGLCYRRLSQLDSGAQCLVLLIYHCCRRRLNAYVRAGFPSNVAGQ